MNNKEKLFKMTAIKVWDGKQDRADQQEWIDHVHNLRAFSGKDYGIDLKEITIAGKCLGKNRLGLNYKIVFPKWLDLRVNVDTNDGVKTTEHLGVDYDATLLDIISALPLYARFRMTAEDGHGKFKLKLDGVKSYEATANTLQEVELTRCEISYKG